MDKKITIVTKLGDHFKVANLAETYAKKPICVHFTQETGIVEVSFITARRLIKKVKYDLKIMNVCGINGWIREKKL